MNRSCWCVNPADAMMLMICWCWWYTDAVDALMLLNRDQDMLVDLSIAICSSSKCTRLVHLLSFASLLYLFCVKYLLCCCSNEARVQSTVSLPNSRIPPAVSRVVSIYCFVFLSILALLLIVSTLTWIYVPGFPAWDWLWWKQSGRCVSPVCTKPRLSGSYQPLPPSCHLSSLFSPSPEWIPLILSTLAFRGLATLLAGSAPCPLHLPYLRLWPAPLLHVPSRIQSLQMHHHTSNIYRYGWYRVRYVLKLNSHFLWYIWFTVSLHITFLLLVKRICSSLSVDDFLHPKYTASPSQKAYFDQVTSFGWLAIWEMRQIIDGDANHFRTLKISPMLQWRLQRDNWQRLIWKKKKQMRGIVAPYCSLWRFSQIRCCNIIVSGGASIIVNRVLARLLMLSQQHARLWKRLA